MMISSSNNGMAVNNAHSNALEFQVFAWNISDSTENLEDCENANVTVDMFGKTAEGKSVALQVKGYTPQFCVKFSKEISTYENYQLLTELLQSLLVRWEYDEYSKKWKKLGDCSDHLVEFDREEAIIRKKDCWGFNFNTEEPFFVFGFKSLYAYKTIKSYFQSCQNAKLDDEQMQEFIDEWSSVEQEEQFEVTKDYEQKFGVLKKALKFLSKLEKNGLSREFSKGKLFNIIDPLLPFAHMRNLKMAGWTRIEKPVYSTINYKETTCDLEAKCEYEDVYPIERDTINPHIKEMAFDIEAYSADGSFPDPGEPLNFCYQIGITIKQYAEKKFDRILFHMETPKEIREEKTTGKCNEIMPEIPTCLRSLRPVADCEKEECKEGHDVYNVKTQVFNYKTEKDLLLAFSDFIIREDPDLIYAYNSDIFDWNYIMERSKVAGCSEKFSRMSRIKKYRCEAKEAKFASSAYGDNKYMRVEIPGRLNIDVMIWIQRNMPADRYPSYTLNSVAEKELGDKKRDVDAQDIFKAFKKGETEELTKIGDYCCQDTVLVQNLVIKLDIVTQMFEMANITDTPPMYLLQKGQQIKCFSQLSKEAREKDFLIPLTEERDDTAFKGAIVLDPKIGKYDTPVSVLDFASLYPSIQMAYNVCYTTIVLLQSLHDTLEDLYQRNEDLVIRGISFDPIEWSEEYYVYRNHESGKRLEFNNIDDAKKMMKKKDILANISRNDDSEKITWRIEEKRFRYYYAQKQTSLIPELQMKLKKNRKSVKAMMAPIEHSKDPEDQLKYRVLNGRQLAIKVSMNSIYGFTSAFMMNLPALSASVTAKGRQMIQQSQDYMEKRFETIAKTNFWSKEDFLTFFAKDGKEIQAEEVEDEWIFCFRGEEICRTKKGETPKGWIKKYPVAIEGKPWTDHDLGITVVGGDSVTGDTPVLCRDEKGLMMYKTFENLATSHWQLRHDGKEYASCDFEVWSSNGFTKVKHLIRHYTDKQMFRVCTKSGMVDVTEDHSLLTSSAEKISPKDILLGQDLLHSNLPQECEQPLTEFDEKEAYLFGRHYAKFSIRNSTEIPDRIINAPRLIRWSFLKGYITEQLPWDETKDDDSMFIMSVAGKSNAAKIFHLFSSLDFTVTIVTLDEFDNLFKLRCHKNKSLIWNDLDAIYRITTLPKTDQYVYDIETENHHFHAGPGRLIVHNTDSVFCNYPHSSNAEAISLSHKAAELLTDDIFNRAPIEMEYEKTYNPFYVVKKKNYAALKFEMDDVRFKVDYKGLAPKRRNYCKFVKDTYWSIIYPALGIETFVKPNGKTDIRKVEWDLKLRDVKALEGLEKCLKRLVDGDVELDDFVISASLKSDYKGETCEICDGKKSPLCKDANCTKKGKHTKNFHCDKCNKKNTTCQKCYCSHCGGLGKIINLTHVQLAKRMKERDFGSEPISGQRFGYVVVNDPTRPDDLSAKSEDVAYAKEHGLKPDMLYYLEQQVRKPVSKFLALLDKNGQTDRIFDEAQQQIFAQMKKQRQALELDARKNFFTTAPKRKLEVKALKNPKKGPSKKQKVEEIKTTTKDIRNFFG